MEKESQAEHGGIERKMAVTQLLQIKYLLAGILGLIVVGRDRDWEVNLGTIALTFWLVYSVETFCAWIPGSASRLASIHRRRKTAAAESDQRMRQVLQDLEPAKRKIRTDNSETSQKLRM
jgi:hypothetical protein